MTIFGRNFGAYSTTTSQVVFLGSTNSQTGQQPADLNSACINFWQDDQIIIAVPAGVETGPIKVITADNLSDSTTDDYGPRIPDFEANNIVRPGLCALHPASGLLLAPINYAGLNLYNGTAYFGNYENSVRGLDSDFSDPEGLTGTTLTPNIRAGEVSSFVIASLGGNALASNYLRFQKEKEPGSGPFIISFSPVSGSAGQYVTIRGHGFGGARGNSRVYFGETEAAYDFPDVCLGSVWKDDQIIVKVPAGLADGDYTLRIRLPDAVIDTQKLNPGTFQVDQNLILKPSLCKIEPTRGPAATPVSLWGEYFGNVGNAGRAEFTHEKEASGEISQDGRAERIDTSVPVGAITGPVHIVKNNNYGNDLNFMVGACTADSDCGTDVCCPANTYKEGRCVSSLADCYFDVNTAVFEWSFATGIIPNFYSCAGAGGYYGSCQAGDTCPNVPGVCSPYAGGAKVAVAACDSSCNSISACNNFVPNNCTYDPGLDKCLKNDDNATCDLPQEFTYTYISGGKELTATATKTCNQNGQWEIVLAGSCPEGWTRTAGNRCVDGACGACPDSLTCESIDGSGRCASAKICPAGAICEADLNNQGTDKCFVTKAASCDCCCQIGQSARDCCAPLQCEGTCGVDTGKTTNVTWGRCGGCKSAGATPQQRDAACNCSGHSGQYCEINDPAFPDGVCTDCTGLSGPNCADHNGVCCLDANKTETAVDDICRGGSALSADPANPGYGYCAYYDCSADNPLECATSTPVKIGVYSNQSACVNDCPNSNPCAGLTDLQACAASDRCCFDAKIGGDAKCRVGDKISGSDDYGYCAYYNCEAAAATSTPGAGCATSTPAKDGLYTTISACDYYCANSPSGPGLSCALNATSTCESEVCNFPGFSCLLESGDWGTAPPDCGTCCCDPDAAEDACTALNSNLNCLADKGACTGSGRGLCCGCSNDGECGSPATVGCGNDTCCAARPQITSTVPANLATGVCRNAVISVSFDQVMDPATFANNILLLEERDYGNGVCPSGTFITAADSFPNFLAKTDKNWLAHLFGRLSLAWQKLKARLSGDAFAAPLGPDKLYCSLPGVAEEEISGDSGTLIFRPQSLLAAGATYYLVVKGDENLDSLSGVLSQKEIGFNGPGYLSAQGYLEGEFRPFNGRAYKNSQIFKFSTLSDQSESAGICAVDHLLVSPASYLFRTTANDPNEKDTNPNDPSFDTKADKDKVFSAWAYSAGNQPLQPVTGYFWDWNWSIADSGIASEQAVADLAPNRVLVSASPGVTDAETDLDAALDMSRFLDGTCDSDPACVCSDATCSVNCCNFYSTGTNLAKRATLYIFVCNNPWPPVAADGTWWPWSDTADNCGAGGEDCANYNYKFYYCRDAGQSGTLDDLPAIISPAVTRGQSEALVCSSDKTVPCSQANSLCGPDKNGDDSPDGLCIWNVLKESYFFRETILPPGEIDSAVDDRTGGKVQVTWHSKADQVAGYKIYYLKAGQGSMSTKDVALDACSQANGNYACQAIVSNLVNNQAYIFKVSVISVNHTESVLSNEKTATPTDATPPPVPTNFQAEVDETNVAFSWFNLVGIGGEPVVFRLYHGLSSGHYGESFDSAENAGSMTIALSQFPAGANYFALSAIDAAGNESVKSEIIFNLP